MQDADAPTACASHICQDHNSVSFDLRLGDRQVARVHARERRVVHMTLRDDPSVETESGPEERGGVKRVIVRAVH